VSKIVCAVTATVDFGTVCRVRFCGAVGEGFCEGFVVLACFDA